MHLKNKNLWTSFNNAINGIIYVAKTQRNIRLHFLIAILVLIGSLFINLTKVEVIIIIFTITFILVTEIFNSAIEVVINLITDTYHPLARIAKDIAAGAVLLASVNAVIVGYLIFVRFIKLYIESRLESVFFKIQRLPEHLTIVCLLIVVISVILGKTIFKRGSPMRGGMPSGHSALAFAIWAITLYVYPFKFFVISVPVFVLAVLVLHSRVIMGIHSWWEVFTGALVGFFITTLIFQLFAKTVLMYGN